MALDLRQLKALSAVARQGGFSRAARQTGLTQPTLSTHIRNLESQLGVRLFDRSGRSVILTPAGRLFTEYAERILDLCEQSVEAVQAFLGEISGQLEVDASTVPGEYLLPRWLAAFSLACPAVLVTLSVRDSDAVRERVAAGEVPVGVIGSPASGPHLHSRKLCADEVILVVSPALPGLADPGRAIPKRQFSRLPLIRREPGSGTQSAVEKALRSIGLDPDAMNWSSTLGSTRAVIEGAVSGLGAAFASRRTVDRELADGSLRELRVRGLSIKRDFFIITNSARSLSPVAARFLEFLEERGREEG